ncbi:MAG: alpha/beta fold hydrolase [Gammaproteobacteria bacterium]
MLASPVELAYNDYGSGPPLIVLHGLFGSGRNWRHHAAQWAATHHVYCLDMRNHGGSPWRDAMRYEDMAVDVVAFVEAHGLRDVTVLGHSMGGKTAMLTTLKNRGPVTRLVVVDIAPVDYAHSWLPEVEAMQSLGMDTITTRTQAGEQLRERIPDETTRAFLLQNLVRKDGHLEWRINLPAIAAHMAELTGFPEVGDATFAGRAAFIHGAGSDYVAAQHRARISELFPRAVVTAVEGAGHWVHADQPQAFGDAVRRFLHEQ